MQEYEKINITIIFFENSDVITNSNFDAADDVGGWNEAWFPKQKD